MHFCVAIVLQIDKRADVNGGVLIATLEWIFVSALKIKYKIAYLITFWISMLTYFRIIHLISCFGR